MMMMMMMMMMIMPSREFTRRWGHMATEALSRVLGNPHRGSGEKPLVRGPDSVTVSSKNFLKLEHRQRTC